MLPMIPATPLRCTLLLATLITTVALCAEAQQDYKEFDVVSIHETLSSDKPSSNFPLDPTVRYNYHGNMLSAHNAPLLQLLVFAYAKNMYQITELRRQLPAWAADTHFDIQARTVGSPTKDQMRAMTRTLLADRFQLKIHIETRETSVLRLEPIHPGKLGPNMQPYSETEPACDPFPPYGEVKVATTPDGLPAYCGVMVWIPGANPGIMRVGGRRLTPADIALAVGAAADFTGLPVVDGTNLTGLWDALFEYAPGYSDAAHADLPGLTLDEALNKQLGLRLKPGKGPVDTWIIDHVSKPTSN